MLPISYINELVDGYSKMIAAETNLQKLEDLRVLLLGKNGIISNRLKEIGSFPLSDKSETPQRARRRSAVS